MQQLNYMAPNRNCDLNSALVPPAEKDFVPLNVAREWVRPNKSLGSYSLRVNRARSQSVAANGQHGGSNGKNGYQAAPFRGGGQGNWMDHWLQNGLAVELAAVVRIGSDPATRSKWDVGPR